MNPVAALYGSVKALSANAEWTDHFDLSRKGLQQSFIALALTIPAFYLIGHAVEVERARQLGEGLRSIPLIPFAIILLLYLLCFSACAYIFAMVFDKQDRFRSWVITRHWSVFWLALIVSGLFGLYLIGVLPFAIVNYLALAGFLGILALDIRLAQTIGEFKISPAILIGCVINAMGLVVLLFGIAEFA